MITQYHKITGGEKDFFIKYDNVVTLIVRYSIIEIVVEGSPWYVNKYMCDNFPNDAGNIWAWIYRQMDIIAGKKALSFAVRNSPYHCPLVSSRWNKYG